MKIKSLKKIAVSTMALAMGAALAGSISGTVAWYQYSTRSVVSYSGASAHCTENLQVRLYREATPAVAALTGDAAINPAKTYYTATASTGEGYLDDGTNHYTKVATPVVGDIATYYEVSVLGNDEGGEDEWRSDLRLSTVQSYLRSIRNTADYKLRPVTSGELAENAVATTFYKNPLYQFESKTLWGTATEMDYVNLPLEFRVLDVDGTGTSFLAKKLYLTDLQIVDGGANEDITDALRVAFDGASDVTYSLQGEDVNVYGKLDLNNDGVFDLKEADQYNMVAVVATTDDIDDVEGLAVNDLVGVEADQKVYKITAVDPSVTYSEVEDARYCLYGDSAAVAKSTKLLPANLASDADPYAITGTALGTTNEDGTALTINVRIYLEGWQELDGSAIWDAADYIGSDFRINMRFSVEAHENH